jgi:cation diffusion facilitator CzcD-associated flavoprotein CzcO
MSLIHPHSSTLLARRVRHWHADKPFPPPCRLALLAVTIAGKQFSSTNMDPLQEEAIHNERRIKIICVGAGASGLCLAYKLQRSFQKFSLTVRYQIAHTYNRNLTFRQIYDKNPEVGGTWYENRYPGAACDVPSHNYVYSFEPKAEFSSVYAGSAELQNYFQEFVRKHELDKYLRLSHCVVSTKWLETEGQWAVESQSLITGEIIHDRCHILVHAYGYLNKPGWPQLPGREGYKGIAVHSADYDRNLSLKDRDVLLIGAGSSAVQILPAIQPIVKSVTIFIRSPAWLLPDISTEARVYTKEEIEKLVREPDVLLKLRQENERTVNSIFSKFHSD